MQENYKQHEDVADGMVVAQAWGLPITGVTICYLHIKIIFIYRHMNKIWPLQYIALTRYALSFHNNLH